MRSNIVYVLTKVGNKWKVLLISLGKKNCMSPSQKKIKKNCMSHALNHGNNYWYN